MGDSEVAGVVDYFGKLKTFWKKAVANYFHIATPKKL